MHATTNVIVIYMIDTIRVKIPLSVFDESVFQRISVEKSGNLQFKYFRDVIQVGSFSYFIQVFINKNSEMFLEFSVPKYKFSNNIQQATFEDITEVMAEIHNYFSKIPNFNIPHYTTWIVQRLDLCFYKKSSNPYKEIYFLHNLDFPRKKKYIYDTSVMFVGSSYSIKAYIKYDEFFRHDFKEILKSNINQAYLLLEQSKNKIRFELTLRKVALSNILKITNPTISDIIENKILLKTFFKGSLRKILAFTKFKDMKQLNLLDLLKKRYNPKKAFILYQFWTFYVSDDINKRIIKEYYSRSQIYRNLSDIKKVLNF